MNILRPFLRYPGGKSKHVHKILQYFYDQEKEYREPFVGGGSVYLGGSQFSNSWINDLDPEVCDLWRMVKKEHHSLISLIKEHTKVLDHCQDKRKIKEAVALWNQIKSDTNNEIFPAGYRFLFLSKTCFNGVVTAGPTGGIAQNGDYNLMSRWAGRQTIRRICQIHERLIDCRVTGYSWEEVVAEPGKDVALYLDPPYLEKGEQCYQKFFTLEDHRKLAEVVTACPHRYIVTVDDVPEVRNAWSDCGVPNSRLIPETWLYSMTGSRKKNKNGKELFIMDERSLEIAEKRKEVRGDV